MSFSFSPANSTPAPPTAYQSTPARVQRPPPRYAADPTRTPYTNGPPPIASRDRAPASRTPAYAYAPSQGYAAQQPLQMKWRQITTSTDPLPPYHPVGTGQARFTTYPNRLKLGTTGLVQPLAAKEVPLGFAPAAGGGGGGGGTGTPTASSSVLGKRQRTVVNYAEIEGPDDDESDDSDYTGEGRGGRRRRTAAKVQEQKTSEDMPWGEGRNFLGAKPPGNLIYSKVAPRTQHPWLNEESLEEQADESTLLIPITLELTTEHHRISDAFMWNLNEKLITPETFAQIFCKDLDIPLQPHADLVSNSIKSQIEEHMSLFEFLQVETSQPEPEPEAAAAAAGEGKSDGTGMQQDLRVIINLDVQIQTLHLVDRLEWDLASPLTPESFSLQLCSDLALTSESAPLISHAIHAELLKHRRECLELGLQAGGKGLKGVWRDWKEVIGGMWGPRLEIRTTEELDRIAADKERAIRRMRRDTSRFQAQALQGASGRRRR
ncbi:SNF5-domain-containing protein [Atractiella rhizophila]|nr:SNF5-domain-containing protein [Atractiella rhizophila]